MNIVADTNVIVAALRSGKGASHRLLQMVRRGEFVTLHLSAAVVLEYEEVLLRELALTADVDRLVTFNKVHLQPAVDMGIDLLTPSELLQQLRL